MYITVWMHEFNTMCLKCRKVYQRVKQKTQLLSESEARDTNTDDTDHKDEDETQVSCWLCEFV